MLWVTVTGLKEAERIDLASAVDITFEGIAPNVKVLFNVDYDLPYVQYTYTAPAHRKMFF